MVCVDQKFGEHTAFCFGSLVSGVSAGMLEGWGLKLCEMHSLSFLRWNFYAGVGWRPSWGCLQEHPHAASPSGLRFLKIWWLGSEGSEDEREYQADVSSWPSLRRHVASLVPYSIVWDRNDLCPNSKGKNLDQPHTLMRGLSIIL